MSVYVRNTYRTPLLKKLPYCPDQDKINELVEWIISDRTDKDKSYLIKEIPEKSLNYCDELYFKNPLHMAIYKQDLPLIKKLLSYNCNPYAKNPEGKDSFYFAIQTGNTTIFHLIDKFERNRGACWFCTIL